MNAPVNEQSLWVFACERYSQKLEQARLLEAQNTYHVSVCAVLWCQWLDAYKKLLPLAEFESGLTLCDSVDQSVLSPLRALRNQSTIKTTQHGVFDHAKKSLLHAELQIERELLSSLEVLTLSACNGEARGACCHAEFLNQFLASRPQALKALLSIFSK